MAARSTVFDRAYVANPVCMPNRSTLMTGRMPSAHGVIFNNRPDGDWAMKSQTPMGPREGSLTLSSDGDTLTGTMTGPMGQIDISDGKVDGDTLTWIVNATQPIPMTVHFTATVDAIEGEADIGPMGKMTFTGTRKTA